MQKIVITQAKRTEERVWLSEVSNIPLQQSVADLEDLNVSGMVKNRKLSRAISQQGWSEFRAMCEAKSGKYGRDFRVISRWEPTSQVCSDCGFKWGKLDLSVRSILCLDCGMEQDRDGNAAKNIQKVGMGYRHDSKRTVSDHQTTSVASCDETSRLPRSFTAVSISTPIPAHN